MRLEINWDEFFYLSQIYDYQRGELWGPLQSFHIHIFGWVTHFPGNEVDQATVGRFVMLACLTGTCAFIYKFAQTFFSPIASAIATLAFVSAGPVIIHGASFRADPISAAFIMLALVLVAACAGGAPEPASRLVLARFPCLGTCPSYRLTIGADGIV